MFLFFIPSLTERSAKRFTEKQKNYLTLISAIFAIISCMSFPFNLDKGITVDLRWVPIVIFGLYGRIRAGFFLVGIIVIYRFFQDGLGIGVYSSIVAGSFILISLSLIASNFQKSSQRKKLKIACFFTLFIFIIVVLFLYMIFNVFISLKLITIHLALNLICVLFILYFFEAIRESVLMNNRIITSEKMEVFSQLAASISHEVRNPLAAVKGFLQLMEQTELSEEKRKKFIEISLLEINRANDIIGDYLTFAKPSLEEAVVLDVKQELQRIISIILPLANMNCVDIHTEMETYFLKGQSKLFQQCILNIVKNSIEAMPEGGKLFIGSKEDNGKIIVEINDSGNGMTEEQLSRLGEPYFTTKGKEGTGLGMMVAIRIIETMNGKLHVTSKINEGTQFTVYFPKLKDIIIQQAHYLSPQELDH
jgi:two-component system sporulation sensor kinase B